MSVKVLDLGNSIFNTTIISNLITDEQVTLHQVNSNITKGKIHARYTVKKQLS